MIWRDEESGLLIRAGAATQTGGYRERNEDFWLLDSELPLAIVLDGMGGVGGQRAAQLGAEAIAESIRTNHAPDEPAESLLQAAFRAGDGSILHWWSIDPDSGNCSATAVAAWVQQGRVYVSWLGNSRAYRASNGKLEQLTWDHDWANEAVRLKAISADEARYGRVSRNLTRCLGRWGPEPWLEFPSFVPLPGDQLILATDGISVLEESTILNACRTISDPTTCAEAIIEHALMAGSRDNCTCAVIAFGNEELS